MKKRNLVRNRGEVDAWYIEVAHESHCFPNYKKHRTALEAKRDYLAETSVIEEFTEEIIRLREQDILCGCKPRFYKRIYSKIGSSAELGMRRTKRYGKSFCEGMNVSEQLSQ